MLTIREFQMLPEMEMAFRLPKEAEVVGLLTRPTRLRIEVDDSVLHPEETRIFRLVTPIDAEPFEQTGWKHIHTSFIGGENPHDMWYAVHVWELTLEDELDSLEIERQLLDRP